MSKMNMERKLQISSVLVMAGLLIELITLVWLHPFSFLSFIFLGGTLMAAGIIFYLFTLISNPKAS